MSDESTQDQHPVGMEIIYDGDCPFCANYVRLAKLRANLGSVQLTDARQHPQLAADLLRKGYDLDQGMLVIHNQKPYFGSEAMQFIARNSSTSPFGHVMSHTTLARVVYPLLRMGRAAVLSALRRPRLNRQEDSDRARDGKR